jgi:hypothetical protein
LARRDVPQAGIDPDQDEGLLAVSGEQYASDGGVVAELVDQALRDAVGSQRRRRDDAPDVDRGARPHRDGGVGEADHLADALHSRHVFRKAGDMAHEARRQHVLVLEDHAHVGLVDRPEHGLELLGRPHDVVLLYEERRERHVHALKGQAAAGADHGHGRDDQDQPLVLDHLVPYLVEEAVHHWIPLGPQSSLTTSAPR